MRRRAVYKDTRKIFKPDGNLLFLCSKSRVMIEIILVTLFFVVFKKTMFDTFVIDSFKFPEF